MQDARTRLEAILSERIAVLDGAWGVLIQREVPGEEASAASASPTIRATSRRPRPAQPDRPEVVLGIHRAYFAAGADIATTNTFTATTIGQADYGLEDEVYELNVAGAQLARQAARRGRRLRRRLGRPAERHALALAPRRRPRLSHAHVRRGAGGLRGADPRRSRDGGVDLLLIETIFDTLNAKAAIAAALDEAPELPLWISFTAIDRSGRTLSGQTVEAFWLAVEHAKPFIVGVNCSLGAKQMRPFVEDLARVAPTCVAAHPNAGLPNAFGGYDEQPQDTSQRAARVRPGRSAQRRRRLLRHDARAHGAIAAAVAGSRRGACPSRPHRSTRFSGLEPFAIAPTRTS